MGGAARRVLAAALAAATGGGPAAAQGPGLGFPLGVPAEGPEALPLGVPLGPGVLTIDPERLFAGSALGRQMAAELEAALRELAAENRTIEARLTAEERALTEQRATLPPEQFRPLAEAFDAKVEDIRRAQEAKSRALNRRRDEDRQRFLEAALPVLAAILAERGAAVVLDRRAVFLSFDEIDITDEAIRRLDALAPEGAPPGPPPAEAPDPGAPAPAPAE